jgi:branched-chain amino acid aminotransferase
VLTVSSLWINGSLHPADTARIDPFDHGLTTGDGVFEATELVDGVPFATTRHLRRLHRSAAALGLRVPYPDEVLAAAMAEVGAGVGHDETQPAKIRLTMTGGAGPLGSGRGDSVATVIIAAASSGAPWAADEAVHVVPWTRNERGAMAGVKSTSYAENVIALQTAHEAGAGEAIFANTVGNLCEGTGTNVFLVHDGTLVTPPLSSGCLAGVTRELLMEIIDVEERDVPIEALSTCSEAFLSSSTRRVQPIRSVSGLELANCPGPATVAAKAAFADLMSRGLDP